jgi:hypothetical protein
MTVPIQWIVTRGVLLRNLFIKRMNVYLTHDLNVSKLKHVDLSAYISTDPAYGSTPQKIKILLERCSLLTSLHVTNTLFFNDNFILHCLGPKLLEQLTELRIVLNSSSFGHKAYMHLVSCTKYVETLVIIMDAQKPVEQVIVDIVTKNPRLLKAVLISLQFIVIEPDQQILEKWNNIIQNNIRVAKFILYENSIDCLLYFTSEKKNCLIGFDCRHGQSNSKYKIIEGNWICSADKNGNNFVAFHESFARPYDNAAMRLHSFFTHYGGFASIYLVSSSLNNNLIDDITKHIMNVNSLETVSFGKSSIKSSHDSFNEVSVGNIQRLMQACKILKRIELRHFQHYNMFDYVSLFSPPSSVRQIQLVGFHDKISVDTVFAILDAAQHIEFIELVFESDHVYNLYVVRLHLLRKCCKLRGNKFCVNTKNHERECGRYQIFRKLSTTYVNFLKTGQVDFYDWRNKNIAVIK